MALKIVFYGTPEFAVASLDRLVKDHADIAAVVTSPDKPAGRGQKLTISPVKDFALENSLRILQPPNMKDESFLKELKEINPDLQIVVAFRMMPEAVWKLPKMGTFNLHASLLPQYRGAAPINWAVINGEKETGATTFFLRHEIDTGSIIMHEKVMIGDFETAGMLHDKLMKTGAELVSKTVQALEHGNYQLTEQRKPENGTLNAAPKLDRQNTKINFDKSPDEVRNFVRGLSPYPGAHTELYSDSGLSLMLKIYSVEAENAPHNKPPGTVESDQKSFLKVFVRDGVILIKELQVAGRNKISIKDFLNGFKVEGNWVMR